MTIKELEARTGMDRGTIRFYEKEGLLSPERQANGYRDYSAEDAQTLEKIAFLRQLGLSLEMIRTVQTGELPLGVVLEKQREIILHQQEEGEVALQLCDLLRKEGASYETLQPLKYRAQLLSSQWEPRVIPPAEPKKHYATRHPWRRLFARELDMGLYLLPWWITLSVLGLVDWASWISTALVSLLLPLLLESVLLCTLGTTPGKWLMGLTLRRQYVGEICKPTFRDAVFRTLHLYVVGCGLGLIPTVCYIFAYLRANRGEDQPWDELWEYTAEETIPGSRFVVLFAALLAVNFAQNKELELLETRLNNQQEEQRKERIPTVQEFVSSVNEVLAVHRDFADFRYITLNNDGTWNDWETDISAFDLTITEENGKFCSAVAEVVYPGSMEGVRPDGVELYYALKLGLWQAQGYDMTWEAAHTAAESYRDLGSWQGEWGTAYNVEPDEDELEQYFLLNDEGYLPRGGQETPDLRITISVGKIENPYADWYGGEVGK